MAKDTNSRMDSAARRAREHYEEKMDRKYKEFSEQVKKYHEKLVMRQEELDYKQALTKWKNDERFQRHIENSKNLKQLDQDKLLSQIEEKEKLGGERVARK